MIDFKLLIGTAMNLAAVVSVIYFELILGNYFHDK